jgi:putative transposase
MVTPAAKREAVGHLRSAFEVSERRACTVIGADRVGPLPSQASRR